jgi:hypothetical protein
VQARFNIVQTIYTVMPRPPIAIPDRHVLTMTCMAQYMRGVPRS